MHHGRAARVWPAENIVGKASAGRVGGLVRVRPFGGRLLWNRGGGSDIGQNIRRDICHIVPYEERGLHGSHIFDAGGDVGRESRQGQKSGENGQEDGATRERADDFVGLYVNFRVHPYDDGGIFAEAI